ncbi:MAG: leucine-rich repeat protein [Clostridia bacterium]|nr:leucine-rich repeat protein [Clostridia bacterium]
MKKVLSVLLAAVMLVSIFTALPVMANADSSGSCGPTVSYTLDAEGKLTISGTGDTNDYNDPSPFDSNTNIKYIVIEPGVRSIGNYLFYGCSNVRSVRIPASVQSIGTGAFMNCSSLEYVMIPDGVTSIVQAAFMNCTSLMCAGIPKTVKNIGASAFGSCEDLRTVYYGGTASDWQGITFGYNNAQLSKVTLQTQCQTGYCGDEVYFLFFETNGMLDVRGHGSTDDYADFDVCPEFYTKFREQITEVYSDQGVTRVGEGLFYDLPNVTYACVSDEVTDLGGAAFRLCTSLTDVDMSWSLTTMGMSAFSDCTSLETIEFQEGLTEIPDSCFHNCPKLKNVTIPSTVTIIRDSAFNACTGLENIVIPEGVKTIMKHAFKFCTGLKNVTIPSSVTVLNENAFNGASEDFTVTASCLQTKIEPILEGTNRTWNKVHDFNVTVVEPEENMLGFTHHDCLKCHYWFIDAYTGPTGKVKVFKCAARTVAAEKLVWNDMEDVTGFQIQISNAAGNKWEKAYPTANTYYVFKGLTAGGNYKFRIRTFITAADGKNYFGPWVAIASPTLPAPTGVVKTISCKARTATAEIITWSAIKGAQGYQIQISNAAGNKWEKTYNAKTATSYVFKNLTPGGNYKFRVRLYAKAFDGSYCFAGWKALASPTLPATTSVKATAAKKAFTAQWRRKAVTGYQIQYGVKANFSGAKTLTVKNAKTYKYTVKNLKAKTNYNVRIRTYKTIGGKNYFSTWSKAVKVKTK